LPPGGYQVTVSDSYLCTASAQAVIIQPAAPLSATSEITHVLCHGDFTGAINITPAGGTVPYSYAWSSGQNTQDLTNIPAGTYTLTITDFHLCTFVITETVIEPAAVLSTIIVGTDVRCFGENNGSIDITTSGGTPPYTYLWNTGSASEDLSQLLEGYYRVTVTDSHGCTTIASVNINEPSEVIIDVTQPQYICIGQSATIVCSATGGTPWYSYFWSNNYNDSIQIVSPTVTSNYSVYAVDTRGCISPTRHTTVYVYPEITADVYAVNPDICAGQPVVVASNSSGGNGNLSYSINGNWISMPHVFYTEDDTAFTVTVSDNCGTPSDISFINITIKPSPPVSFVADTTEGCVPLYVHFIEGSPDMGQIYHWDFGDLGSSNYSSNKAPTHIYDEPGSYTVSLTVTAANGCQTSQISPDFINAYPVPEAAFIANPNAVNVVNTLVRFTNLSTFASDYFWFFGDGDTTNELHPLHVYPPIPTDYIVTLVAISPFGCSDTVKGKILVKGDYTFYAPTGFSPNEDNKNEFFMVYGTNIDNDNFKLRIYDRWGEAIFESKSILKGWDGRVKNNLPAPIGTYTWIAIFKDSNGVLHEEAGKVSLIR
ncbi:MAG: hypothetical protein CVU05_01760, partial [Bacteroidetes bacterium HGW-Bacteroidetes-21]|jgi:gliding motility-associated-like protein